MGFNFSGLLVYPTNALGKCLSHCDAAGGLHGDPCGVVLGSFPDCHAVVAQQGCSYDLPHLLCICVSMEW